MPQVKRNIEIGEEANVRTGLLEYDATPTARLFHNSDKLYRFLFGPVGCGKSVACVFELLMRSMRQKPYKGVRRTRWAVVRSTYPQLKSTTIKTFQRWIPNNVCPIVYDVPIRGNFRQKLSDGTICEIEFVFLALESEEDIAKLLSLELTGMWVNEIRELPKEVFDYIRGRLPRYPDEIEGGASWYGILGDTNPPKIGHWIHELFEGEERHSDFELFRFPPAVYFDNKTQTWEANPDAENLNHLNANYYKQQIQGNSEGYIRVMLAGEYGILQAGKPIYPQFSQHRHVSKEIIKGDRGLPLILGFDFGLNPACIFNQLSRRGKLCIIDELAPADEDLESFLADYVIPLLNEKYNGFSYHCVGDPAARGRSGLDKRTAFDVLADFNLKLTLAPTNNFTPRKEAVDWFLNRNEGLLISPHCNYMIEGMGGGYVYEKMSNTMAGAKRYKDRAEKNAYSHGQDAEQYVALYVRKGSGIQRAGKMLNGMGNDNKPKQKFLWA
jgi:hypothetical protein